MKPPGFETIIYAQEARNVTVTFNRPEMLNAFSSQMYGEVKNALRIAEHDEEVDTVVIKGSGRAFATGGDLIELLECLDSDDPLAVYRFDDRLPFDVLRNMGKTTIAAVNGICVAGGLMVTLMCDISIAEESATFGAPEARVGLADAFLPSLLFGRVSIPQAKYLLYTGKHISANDALEIGLITKVVPDGELDKAVAQVLEELAKTALPARRLYKAYVNRLIPPAHIADSHPAMRSPEAIERLRKFASRKSS